MRLSAVVGEGAKELGARFLLVGLLPSAFLTLLVVALLWSGAPASAPDAVRAARAVEALGGSDAALFGLAVMLLALLLQPLQLAIVQLLEGYWGPLATGSGAWGALWAGRHRRAKGRLTRALAGDDPRAANDAAWRLRYYYPQHDDRVMPTRLGNVLRAAEDFPELQYGLDAVVAWPRLYPLLPERLAALLDDQRLQLDLAARLTATLALAAAVSAALLARHGGWLAVPVALAALAWLAYTGAVHAAVAYGEQVQSAFDLHRFDLLTALRQPLPADQAAERAANAALCDVLRPGGAGESLRYTHAPARRALAPE